MLQTGEWAGKGDGELKFQGSENLTDIAPSRKGSKFVSRINGQPSLNLKIINK